MAASVRDTYRWAPRFARDSGKGRAVERCRSIRSCGRLVGPATQHDATAAAEPRNPRHPWRLRERAFTKRPSKKVPAVTSALVQLPQCGVAKGCLPACAHATAKTYRHGRCWTVLKQSPSRAACRTRDRRSMRRWSRRERFRSRCNDAAIDGDPRTASDASATPSRARISAPAKPISYANKGANHANSYIARCCRASQSA